jgi:hypothetical protein
MRENDIPARIDKGLLCKTRTIITVLFLCGGQEGPSVVSSLGRPALHIDYALSIRSNFDIIHLLEMEVEKRSCKGRLRGCGEESSSPHCDSSVSISDSCSAFELQMWGRKRGVVVSRQKSS